VEGFVRVSFSCIVVAWAASAFGASPDTGRVLQQFKSENYSITWGIAQAFEPDAELTIGDGAGHGFTLGWLRFRPENERVVVLSLQFNGDRQPRRSKWPPDLAPVVVKQAPMKPDAYAMLLQDLAILDAAELSPIRRNSMTMSTSDFWVQARLTAQKETRLDLEWAGYWSSDNEVNFAKPQAAVALARAAIKGLDFQPHLLTDEERSWASAKFVQDWKKNGDLSHWWVRERQIIMIGVVGDASALATLREVLQGSPQDRSVYYAINAITRLTKQDVRDKPVEEMDVAKTRRRVLDMLPERN